MDLIRIDDSERQDDHDKHFRIDEIQMIDNGDQKVGYIKLSYIPSYLNFDLISFLRLRGTRVGKCFDDLRNVTDPKERHTSTFHLAMAARGIPWGIANELAKDSESTDDYLGFLYATGIMDAVHETFDAEHQMYTNYFVDKPLVDFIRIAESHQGRGLGLTLYKEAAKWMAEKNMRVVLSSIKCHPAVNTLHQKMKDMGMLDEVTVNWYNDTKKRYVINYER